jgi:flagellar operon protein
VVENIFIPSPLQITPTQPATRPKPITGVEDRNRFSRILDEKLPVQGLKFSQHAQERLKSRGITLTEADMKRLEGAVDSVAQKGGRESLVMMGDAALVVSVKNRTIVTAMDKSQMMGNVFTNIDSAVML